MGKKQWRYNRFCCTLRLLGDTLEKKLEELKKQQQVAKELYLKLQGAIELLEEMMKEKDDKKKV